MYERTKKNGQWVPKTKWNRNASTSKGRPTRATTTMMIQMAGGCKKAVE